MDQEKHRKALIALLKLAYSGEKAAAYAYSGHWRSVKDEQEKERIQQIEQEEWEHRATVGDMLEKLGEKPQYWRELLMGFIGKSASIGCFVSGWFLPMYFAGKLENDNVREYDTAAFHAHEIGMDEFTPKLKEMSKTEVEHELFFSGKARGHKLLPLVQFFVRWDPEVVYLEASKELE